MIIPSVEKVYPRSAPCDRAGASRLRGKATSSQNLIAAKIGRGGVLTKNSGHIPLPFLGLGKFMAFPPIAAKRPLRARVPGMRPQAAVDFWEEDQLQDPEFGMW